MDIFNMIEHNKRYSQQLKIILLILERENCRSKEILSAEWRNFYPGNFLILKGSKKSADIIVRDSIILRMIDKLPDHKSKLIFPDVSYSQLYRVVKQEYSHLFIKFKGKKNYKVTHGFRYLKANLTNEVKEVKAILHHNSQTSGKFYNKKLK